MNYQRVYNRLISSRQKLGRSKSDNCCYESHHIVPRCLGGSYDESNLVLLTAREHFIAHQLLTKIYPKNQKLLFAVTAFQMDKTGERKLTSRQIEVAREANAKATTMLNKDRVAKGAHIFLTYSKTPRMRQLSRETMTVLANESVTCQHCGKSGVGGFRSKHLENCTSLIDLSELKRLHAVSTQPKQAGKSRAVLALNLQTGVSFCSLNQYAVDEVLGVGQSNVSRVCSGKLFQIKTWKFVTI